MKKKPFLLLEVLIAIVIVTWIAVPLLTRPILMYRSEMKALEEVERERLADWTFAEVQETLIKHAIPWHQLPDRIGASATFSLPSVPIDIPPTPPKHVKREFELRCKKRGDTSRLLQVTVLLDHKPYSYSLIVEQRKDLAH